MGNSFRQRKHKFTCPDRTQSPFADEKQVGLSCKTQRDSGLGGIGHHGYLRSGSELKTQGLVKRFGHPSPSSSHTIGDYRFIVSRKKNHSVTFEVGDAKHDGDRC